MLLPLISNSRRIAARNMFYKMWRQCIFNHYLNSIYTIIQCVGVFFFSQPEGADLPDDHQLGPGVPHPGSRAGPSDVQPAEAPVWLHRGAASGHEEVLHHQCCIGAGCHQPVGISGSDQVSAVSAHGQGRGETHDWWTWVRQSVARNSHYISNMQFTLWPSRRTFCSQWHHEQQGFLPASQPDESARHAWDCNAGHGQRPGRRQVTGTVGVVLTDFKPWTWGFSVLVLVLTIRPYPGTAEPVLQSSPVFLFTWRNLIPIYILKQRLLPCREGLTHKVVKRNDPGGIRVEAISNQSTRIFLLKGTFKSYSRSLHVLQIWKNEDLYWIIVSVL